jgi:hypothetical protein
MAISALASGAAHESGLVNSLPKKPGASSGLAGRLFHGNMGCPAKHLAL